MSREEWEVFRQLDHIDEEIVKAVGYGELKISDLESEVKAARNTIWNHVEVLIAKNILKDRKGGFPQIRWLALTDRGKNYFDYLERNRRVHAMLFAPKEFTIERLSIERKLEFKDVGRDALCPECGFPLSVSIETDKKTNSIIFHLFCEGDFEDVFDLKIMTGLSNEDLGTFKEKERRSKKMIVEMTRREEDQEAKEELIEDLTNELTEKIQKETKDKDRSSQPSTNSIPKA